MGERFADVNVVDRVAHGGCGVMVWAGVCYGQRTQFTVMFFNTSKKKLNIMKKVNIFCHAFQEVKPIYYIDSLHME